MRYLCAAILKKVKQNGDVRRMGIDGKGKRKVGHKNSHWLYKTWLTQS